MSDRVCFNCSRKVECYTESVRGSLSPDGTYKDMTGYECGVAFTNFDEAKEFIHVIGDAIFSQSKSVQNKIVQYIAEKYNLPLYNVKLELLRDSEE